jgi:hypothetical protein
MQFSYQTISAFMALVLFNSATAAPTFEAAAAPVAWADPWDCHKFYECPAGGTPVHKTCGPGTAFQEKTLVCDYEHLVASCRRH